MDNGTQGIIIILGMIFTYIVLPFIYKRYKDNEEVQQKKKKELERKIIHENKKETLLQSIIYDNYPSKTVEYIKRLTSYYSFDEEIKEALLKALENRDYFVQIEAAKHLAFKGIAHLENLLKKNVLSDLQTIKLIKIICDYNHKQSLPLFKKMLEESESNKIDIKISLLGAFEKMGTTEYRKLIWNQFKVFTTLKDEKNEIFVSIIKALGSCGVISDVERLNNLMDDAPTSEARKEIKKSIKKIQGRQSLSEAGLVSIHEAEEKEGSLSLEKSDEGLLSLEE